MTLSSCYLQQKIKDAPLTHTLQKHLVLHDPERGCLTNTKIATNQIIEERGLLAVTAKIEPHLFPFHLPLLGMNKVQIKSQ